eukprot:2545700-Amphidinium_carterae.2
MTESEVGNGLRHLGQDLLQRSEDNVRASHDTSSVSTTFALPPQSVELSLKSLSKTLPCATKL